MSAHRLALRVLGAVGLVAIGAAISGAVGFARVKKTQADITACVAAANRTLYLPPCLRGDTNITWNKVGPSGPAGPTGPATKWASGLSSTAVALLLKREGAKPTAEVYSKAWENGTPDVRSIKTTCPTFWRAVGGSYVHGRFGAPEGFGIERESDKALVIIGTRLEKDSYAVYYERNHSKVKYQPIIEVAVACIKGPPLRKRPGS